MSCPTKFTMLLLVLQSFRTAPASKVDSLTESLDSLAYHPGHSPYHVTRLHRYEHMGIQSMLEAEAQWTREVHELQKSSAAGRVLREVRHIRGSSLLQESHEVANVHSEFVKVSDIQSRALQEHHQSWTAWLQTADGSALDKVMKGTARKSLKHNATPFNPALIQKFKVNLNAYRQHHSGDDAVVATGLSSLSSQYVGPVGVGTVISPSDCVMKEGATPVETNSSMLDQIGGFLSTQWTNISGKVASSFTESCIVKDQSKVWVVFDTGSTNIWISSDLCKSGACQLPGRHTFNHTASATFKYPQSMLQLSVQFGTGKITGPQAVDDFHIGPFTVYNQTFAMIETESGSVFHDVPFEGIVGMAFDKMSANHVQPFFSSIIEQKALKHNEFAFYFSRDKPSANALLWGGVDKHFYEGKLEYFPVIDPFYWSLKLLNFKIGSDELLGSSDTYSGDSNPTRKWNGPVAVVDTGTTFFTAEGDKFSEVMSKLPPADCTDVTDETHPPITITLENVLGKASDFVLTNKQYMTRSGKDNVRCSPAFMQIDLPHEHGPGMVLGEIFLRHFFAVFDRDTGNDFDAKVALARSSDKPEALSRLHELTKDQPTFGKSASAATEPMLDNVK